MGLFTSKKKEPNKNDLKLKEYEIFSATYFQKNIENIISKKSPINFEYIMEKFSKDTKTLWKYDTLKINGITYAKEPNNKHDKNAIKIMCDYTQIGYIPAENNINFAKLIDSNQIYSSYIVITGGPYKTKSAKDIIINSVEYHVTLKVLIKK